MLYESTRGGIRSVPSAAAIKMGIAPDGGLFVPEANVKFSFGEIEKMSGMSYREKAAEILARFLDDYTREEIEECVGAAYAAEKFSSSDIAPVVKLTENAYVLELWHGPTCAFKDMALQLLPHLLVKAMRKTGETDEVVILVATSGDTGKAALEGFKDVKGTQIIVFFPEEGVSQVQKLQMITQTGSNVHSVGVKGNFDDAQNGVKAIFTDSEFCQLTSSYGYKFSSANSINWGRLVPQIVYYFSAYLDILAKGEIKPEEKVNIVVPTGNFGNILAAFYAMRMGLPINKLICASNENNVLTDFIRTGVYDRNRKFKKTISPSMDILISSNLERLLYELTGHDSEAVSRWMNKLRHEGKYSIDEDTMSKLSQFFWADYTDDKGTMETIKCIYEDCNYLLDTHTAVAVDVYDKYVISTGDMTKAIIASTASPFKFNESVAKAIFGEEAVRGKNEFELLEILSRNCNLPVPDGLKDLDKREIRHRSVCQRLEMKETVKAILGI